jgi:hypothetical protein
MYEILEIVSELLHRWLSTAVLTTPSAYMSPICAAAMLCMVPRCLVRRSCRTAEEKG